MNRYASIAVRAGVVQTFLKKLQKVGIVKCTAGRGAVVYIA